jgi:DNA invertase Pin-like site-specific DNA recombinase
MTRAVIYCRISQDRGKLELGVDRQREGAEKLVADRGWELVGVPYVDNDLGASKGRHRPEYDRMMAAAVRGEFDTIVVFHLSRLWRNRRERAEGIEVLRQARVSVACTKGPEFDMSTAYGRGMTSMVGEVDTMESEIKGERVVEAQRQAAANGLHLGGPRPFGWDLQPDPARAGRPDALRKVKPQLHPTEAPEKLRIAKELLAGRSINALCRDLNDRGILTTRGGPWTPASLRATLLTPRNYGTAIFNDEQFPGAWPAIWPEDTHRKLVTLLTDPARRLSPDGRIKYLLSGIARCGACHKPVKSASTANRDGTRRRLYKCPSEHLFRSQVACDYVVVSEVIGQLTLLPAAERAALLAGEDHDSGAAIDAAALRRKLANLLDLVAEEEIPPEEYRPKAASLRAQLRKAETRMAKVSRAPVLAELLTADDVRACWDGLPLDRQRSVLKALVTPVILKGGTARRAQAPGGGLAAWNSTEVGIGFRIPAGPLALAVMRGMESKGLLSLLDDRDELEQS